MIYIYIYTISNLLSARYTVVALSLASTSNGESSGIKNDGSAIWTPNS